MTKCKAVNTEKENGSNIKERQRLSTPLLTVTTQGGAVAHHRAKEVDGWSPCRGQGWPTTCKGAKLVLMIVELQCTIYYTQCARGGNVGPRHNIKHLLLIHSTYSKKNGILIMLAVKTGENI